MQQKNNNALAYAARDARDVARDAAYDAALAAYRAALLDADDAHEAAAKAAHADVAGLADGVAAK